MALSASELRKDETVLFVVRHHGLFLLFPLLLALVMIAGPWILASVFEWDMDWRVGLVIGVLGLPWLLTRILILRTDTWTITDRRVVDRQGIISRVVKESPFEKIHNATFKQGLLGRIFNYGDVEVQTASAEGFSALKMVKDPARVCRTLMEAVDDDLEGRNTSATGVS